jgi:non-haem Fe2+, alpha-ketoglutarate-dependent halogenase
MNRLLTEAERRRYLDDGIVFPVRVLPSEEAEKYRLACDELEAELGGKPRTIEVRQMHLHFRWAYELATRPRLLDAVEDLLGPDLLIWATELFAKHPQDATVSIGWHRDAPYMGVAGMSTTAWIALSDSTLANGCMRAVLSPRERESGRREEAQVGPSRQSPDAVDVLLRPGEMSLHNSHVLHGSGPNRSQEKRVGFVVRFITPETRPLAGHPPVILARGTDRLNHFRVFDSPTEGNSKRALAQMKESAALHLEGMLQNLRRSRP